MNNLISHYFLLEPMLKEFGNVYFAGGCVRDYHLNKIPRDYDVFILNSGTSKDNVKEQMSKPRWITKFKDFKDAVVRNSSPYVLRNIDLNGDLVQIIWSGKSNVNELINSFDWNICQYAYGKKENGDIGFIHNTPLDTIIKSKTLKLSDPGKIPASCLRRGFIFSERYNMFIDRYDLKTLCEMQIDKFNQEQIKLLSKI